MEEYFIHDLMKDIENEVADTDKRDPNQNRGFSLNYAKYLNENSVQPISEIVIRKITLILENHIKEFWNHINKIL